MGAVLNMVGGGGGKVTLSVAVTNGTATSVVAAKGSDSVSLTYRDGIWSTILPSFGTWTVTITDGTHSNSAMVNASTVGSYTVSIYMPDVPSAYTQLEYIESTGTQYINTGVVAANDNTFEGEFYKFNEPEISSSPYVPYLFGVAKVANDVYTRQQFRYGTGSIGITSWGTSFARPTLDATSGNHVFTASASAFTVDGVTWYVPESTSFPGPGNIYLFAYNLSMAGDDAAATFSSFRYKRLTIRKNGTPIRNFKAAIRKSDSHVGFYDTVNDVFYDNAGTGTFIAGPAV